MSLAKPKLIFIQYIISVNKINKMIVYDFFKYFRKGVKNREWPTVRKECFVTRFIYRDNFCYFKIIWKNTSLNDLLIIYNNDLIYSSMYGLSSVAGRLSHPGLLLVSDDTTSLSYTQLSQAHTCYV